MGSPLAELSLSNPVIAAPMAGGATTPELVIAAAPIGSLGLMLAPDPMPVSLKHFHDYAGRIQTEADAYGVDLRKAEPVEDDDEFHDKIDPAVITGARGRLRLRLPRCPGDSGRREHNQSAIIGSDANVLAQQSLP